MGIRLGGWFSAQTAARGVAAHALSVAALVAPGLLEASEPPAAKPKSLASPAAAASAAA